MLRERCRTRRARCMRAAHRRNELVRLPHLPRTPRSLGRSPRPSPHPWRLTMRTTKPEIWTLSASPSTGRHQHDAFRRDAGEDAVHLGRRTHRRLRHQPRPDRAREPRRVDQRLPPRCRAHGGNTDRKLGRATQARGRTSTQPPRPSGGVAVPSAASVARSGMIVGVLGSRHLSVRIVAALLSRQRRNAT